MGYEQLFAESDLALLHDWLHQAGELYLDLDRPHSGGPNNSVHFIHSLVELKQIISRETFPEICIHIFREKQYPIQGMVDDTLLATALTHIPDHRWFSILALGTAPLAPCAVIGSGDSHDELREELTRLRGKNVRIGQNPFDQDTNFSQSPDDVWVVSFSRHPQPHVSKNRTAYGPFETAPERYRPHIGSW